MATCCRRKGPSSAEDPIRAQGVLLSGAGGGRNGIKKWRDGMQMAVC